MEAIKRRQSIRRRIVNYDRKIKKLEGQGLCGCVYTQWSDIEDEIRESIHMSREVNKLS